MDRYRDDATALRRRKEALDERVDEQNDELERNAMLIVELRAQLAAAEQDAGASRDEDGRAASSASKDATIAHLREALRGELPKAELARLEELAATPPEQQSLRASVGLGWLGVTLWLVFGVAGLGRGQPLFALFALLVALLLAYQRGTRKEIRGTDDGLVIAAGTRQQVVPWHDIAEVRIINSRAGALLEVRTSGASGWIRSSSGYVGDEVLALVDAWRHYDEARRTLGR